MRTPEEIWEPFAHAYVQDRHPTSTVDDYALKAIKLAQAEAAREVLEAICRVACRECGDRPRGAREGDHWTHVIAFGPTIICTASGYRNAILALYPELAQPVEPRAAAHAGVSGLHFAQPGDFTQLHRNEPVEPGKEYVDG